MKKTTKDAVQELGGDAKIVPFGDYPDLHPLLVHDGDIYMWVVPNSSAAQDCSVICTRPEFESTAARMGYPRVTLRPGDYVRCEDISGEAEYHQVAQAFMAAGASEGEYPVRQYFQMGGCFGEIWCFGIREGWANYHGVEDDTFKHGRHLSAAQVLNAKNAQPKPNADTGTEWHERGDLPPVGTECEVHTGTERWERCKILALSAMRHSPIAVFQVGLNPPDWYAQASSFRPLRSDRERWVEQASSVVNKPGSGLQNLYDALLSGELPTPGNDQ